MVRQKFLVMFFLLIYLMSSAFGDVPTPIIHSPNVPYYMQSMNFLSLQMRIFPSRIAGMVFDPYGDLIWNPAYLLRQTKRTIYVDFNAEDSPTVFSAAVAYQYSSYLSSDLVLPDWYTQSSINNMQTAPHYNFAALIPLGSKFVLGFANRLIFDYKPYRSSPVYNSRNEAGWADKADDSYELKRLETDKNQQTVFGIQSEFLLAYKLSNKLDLGLRLGYFDYDRGGDLLDVKWANYPHSSSASLNDESLQIDADQLETGMGVLFHVTEKTRLGFYGSLKTGNSSEKIASIDSSQGWSERDTDSTYYQINHYRLDSDEYYSNDGNRPEFRITFESELSSNFVLRSFLSYSQTEEDVNGSFHSADTSYGDQTYDYYQSGNYYFRRAESHSGRQSNLAGSGTNSNSQWRWFASLIYQPNSNWAAFSGIQLQRDFYEQQIEETSDYKRHDWTEYSIYQPGTYRNYYIHDKNYAYTATFEQWSAFLPIGIKARVFKGLHLIVGSDLTFTLTDRSSEGKLLYPQKISRKWESGRLVVDDKEINRYELFSSHPATEFSRSLAHRFGMMYQHKSGAQLYFRAFQDVFNTVNWALGFEMNW